MAKAASPRLDRVRLDRRRFLAGSAASGLSLALIRPARSADDGQQPLSVFNWFSYIGETTIETFTRRTGVAVRYDVFANNAELLTRLREETTAYDVIFPSDYMLETMVKRDMLAPLDHARLPNLKHLDRDPNFVDPRFNPGLEHGVPYVWGAMGIGYRKSKLESPPDSWSWLFEREKSVRFRDRLALIADPRATLGAALKYLGRSANSTDAPAIARARDLILAIKPNVRTFAPDSGQDLLRAGLVDVAVEWNSDMIDLMEEDRDIGFAVPREGTMLWIDNVCIPAGSRHPENAHAFIDHLHDPGVNAEIANFIRYATPNATARRYVEPADVNNRAIYAPPGLVAKSEVIVDVGPAQLLYDDAWEAIEAA